MPTTIIGRASTSPRIAPLAITKPATVGKIARREVTRRNFTLAAERTALIHSLRSSGGILVADTVNFDWRTAPFRHYASFEDFYRSEPEPTWEIGIKFRRPVAVGWSGHP
jgi:hypothetical protein